VTLLPDVRSQVREAAERQATRRRRHVRLTSLAPVASVIVVIAVAVVFIGMHGRGRSGGSVPPTTVKVVFAAHPTPQVPVVTGAALSRTAEIMRARLKTVFRHAQVTSSGRSVIVIVRGPPSARAQVVSLASTARLTFYDWEANALTQNGTTVAHRLHAQDPHAIEISQGIDGIPPGGPGAGSVTLYDAVKLASKQPAHVSSDNGRVGSEYYAFGAPGSTACVAAAKAHGATSSPATHCLVAGPDDNKQDLLHGLPQDATAPEVLAVPPGTVVLQAADLRTSPTDPRAQFYVLHDHVALDGNEIADPRASTDAGGNPNITFGFTSKGSRAFQQLTVAIARRGDLISGPGQTFNQHFAIALDDELITVPQIDFKTYPDGIRGDGGADISGDFTARFAQDLARRLRLGALPLTLTPT
jgi:SecD/SecF fusion protein